ncbi:MAG TPA: hypothetical protein VF796_10620 [Humisphaera sp.]
MSREHLILCGPPGSRRAPPKSRGGGKTVLLDVTPDSGNLHLRVHDITRRMAADLPPVVHDLVEISSYVFGGDQALYRGDEDGLDYGRRWRRRLRFDVPVRCPDVWRRDAVTGELVRTLSFLSDDDYEFTFRPVRKATPFPSYLEFGDEAAAADVEEVMLFSGGLDSLAGACEEVLDNARKVALVSHRPVTKLDSRQWRLVSDLRDRAGPTVPAPFHVPVLVSQRGTAAREYTQRTRSFLFASFAAAVATMLDRRRIRFYENGVVSCNLPICAQVLGGRASRTTHPRVLAGFERLFRLILDPSFVIENPFLWRTRTDIINGVRAAGHARLIAGSVSCAHTIAAETDRPHCGICSQCVDRRLAAMAAGLTDLEDPPERYRVKLFTDRLDRVKEQTMVERIIGTAREVLAIPGPAEFLRRFGEASRLLGQLPGPPDQNARKLLKLHRDHADEITGVVERELNARFRVGRWHDLPPTCLLRMLAGRAAEAAAPPADGLLAAAYPFPEFTPDAIDWAIIQALLASPTTMDQSEIEAETGVRGNRVSRRTIGTRLRELRRLKIVDRPKGDRGGEHLTPMGRAFAMSKLPKAG